MRKNVKALFALGGLITLSLLWWSFENKNGNQDANRRDRSHPGNTPWNSGEGISGSKIADRDELMRKMRERIQMTPEQIQAVLADFSRMHADQKSLFERCDKDKKDRKKCQEEMKKLREAQRELDRKVHQALAQSEDARKELLRMVQEEPDARSKRELAKFIHSLPADQKEPLERALLASSSPADRMEALHGLQTLGTIPSLNTVVDSGKKDESTEVRRVAVSSVGQALTMSDAMGSQELDDVKYRSVAKTALRDFTSSTNPTEVRISAFQTLATQREISASDKEMFARALKTETDPKVKNAILFANNVATIRSAPRSNPPATRTR